MSRTIRVLLVEDNPADTELTLDTLATSKLHVKIDVVHDGALALAYLFGRPPYAGVDPPDLILLDLNLPKVDGREVLERLKADERLKRIPVVILTSSDAERDIAKSYELGAACYVTKPVGLEEFRAIVRSIEEFWFTVVKLP